MHNIRMYTYVKSLQNCLGLIDAVPIGEGVEGSKHVASTTCALPDTSDTTHPKKNPMKNVWEKSEKKLILICFV